jgi:hypothetical protein
LPNVTHCSFQFQPQAQTLSWLTHGLALEIRDFVTAQFTKDNKVTVEATGQGLELPTDETHNC